MPVQPNFHKKEILVSDDMLQNSDKREPIQRKERQRHLMSLGKYRNDISLTIASKLSQYWQYGITNIFKIYARLCHKKSSDLLNNEMAERIDRLFNYLICILIFLLPQFVYAQETTEAAAGTFDGITAFLKSITKLLILEWGYYIGIITLAIQGYRWKTGRIDLMTLGGWGLGIALVFFAPNIVGDLKTRAGNTL